MSQVQDASSGSAAGSPADSPGGVLTYPNGVTAKASGWQTAIGEVSGLHIRRIDSPELTWDLVCIDELRLSRAAALLMVQGGQLSRIFPPDLTFYEGMHAVLRFRAPPVLLRREETHLFQVPPKVLGVVLGVVVRSGELSEDEIRACMLAHVLG